MYRRRVSKDMSVNSDEKMYRRRGDFMYFNHPVCSCHISETDSCECDIYFPLWKHVASVSRSEIEALLPSAEYIRVLM